MREIFQKKNYQKGMTLIEMLMVVFIFMTISTMILFNYGKFESSISLQNLADDIALSIREAQSYAIGARGIPNGDVNNPDKFFKDYGIHFANLNPSPVSPTGGSTKSFVFFVDFSDYGRYKYKENDSSCGDLIDIHNECYKVISISSADYISNIKSSSGDVLKGVNILFSRPYPEPSFCIITNTSNYECSINTSISYIEIEVKNPRTDKTKTVTITNTGQIVVK